jgi:predicted Co/Zn/Cd cation transporter (cation efflux family)
MINPPIKVKRYYGLRVISTFYKLLAVLTIVICIGAIGYLAVQFFSLDPSIRPNALKYGYGEWAVQALEIAIGGGLIALTFFVLAQVLDVLVSINNNVRALAHRDQIQLASDSGLNSSNLQIAHEIEELRTAIEQQSRLLRLQTSQTPAQQNPPQQNAP